MIRIALALLILVASGGVLAAPASTDAMNIPQFLVHQDCLREDLAGSSRFAHLDNESKRRIYDSQDVLFALLRERRSVDELSDAERLQVFDAQNQIAAVLADAEADRPICENTPRLGSHMHNIDCWSKRQRQAKVDQYRTMMLQEKRCGDSFKCKGD